MATASQSLFNMTGRWGWNPRLPGRYPVSDPATDGALRPRLASPRAEGTRGRPCALTDPPATDAGLTG